MKLRKKTLIAISVTIVGLIVVLYAISQTILLNSFAELEKQDTSTNVERALSALLDEVSDLDTLTYDWAAWDDTYAFIEDVNVDYIDSNLVDATFIDSKLDLMLFINSSGQIVFEKAFDRQNETEIPAPQSFLELLSVDDFLWRHSETESSVNGIVSLTENPMLIASRPILTSEDEGPIRGALIMGRSLDTEEINYLAERTHLSLIVRRFNDSQLPPDFQAALSSLTDEEPIITRPLDEEYIAGYGLKDDIYGNPTLVFRVDMDRHIYKQGQASLFHLISSLMVVSLAFGTVSIVLLEKFILSRLAELNTKVTTIGESGDLSTRISIPGRDELSSLADSINQMLTALEQSQIKLNKAHKQLVKAERLAAIGELATMVAHDLRNPLQGIANISHYLKRKLGSTADKKTSKMLEFIERDIEYSDKIIRDLLEYSGEMRLEPTEATPNSIVKESLALAAIPSNIRITDETQSEPKIKVDVDKMQRVFVNIIKNAIDAMPDGGKLTIKQNETNGNLEIAFIDTGSGIPEDALEKIWKPLFTTKAKGMGMGLPICKRIAEVHEGKISVESMVGKGTTFTVAIPVEPKLKEVREVWTNEPESWLSTTTKP